MDIYAQHGYGKTDKIERGMNSGDLSGVILSPRDEDPDRLSDFVVSLRTSFEDNIKILFDPQFYATTIVPVSDGYLPGYRFYESGLTRAQFIAQRDIQSYVEKTLDYQVDLGLDRLISPSVLFYDFRDPWSQIALSLGQESIIFCEQIRRAPDLLISLVVDENALVNIEALNEFLDIISLWNVPGYYLLIRLKDLNYPALFEQNSITNLIYFVYVLAEINGFEVVCGYSDFVGLLLHAVGAKATAAGWSHTLRQFSLRRFIPSTGGRRALPRYTSAQLLNSILIVPELDAIYDVGLLDRVLSNTKYDDVMRSKNPANATWPSNTACLHHWQVLSGIAKEISSQGSVSQRLTFLEGIIQQGLATYRLLERAGVLFQATTGSRHLQVWLRAIQGFRQEAGI
jgi:hypothetical protein